MTGDVPTAMVGPYALTPLRFLERSASVFADRCAIVDGDLTFTYREFSDRSAQLAAALSRLGVGAGDRVAALCSNSHVMLEMHHGVPALGAVLVPLNTRLSIDELEYILVHSGSGRLVATHEFAETARSLGVRAGVEVIVAGGDDDMYERLLEAEEPVCRADVEEGQLLAINYTSGTTGRPKGVMYHHRGAYLQALAMAYHAGLDPDTQYLWTLPMFHCNGWCFPWAVTAAGGTHICLRAIDTQRIWSLLRDHGVTHLSAAPTVLTMIAEDVSAARLDPGVHVDAGGAPPTPALLERLAALGMSVTHLYGLTETFGPLAINQWRSEWSNLDPDEQARLRARQGVANVVAVSLRVVDGEGVDVAADSEQIGEIVVRGDNVMLGYYRDPEATAVASINGWFRTGDLAVMHSDGYVELKDRRKDIIISGGENISSVEVERVLDSHPDVLECAVVGVSEERWGEVAVAFVTMRVGCQLDQGALRSHLRERMAHFKVPRAFYQLELPKTSTGKILKNVLREKARDEFLARSKHN